MLRDASAILKDIEEQLKSCTGVARKTLADKVRDITFKKS
jgi:hypothetical protein